MSSIIPENINGKSRKEISASYHGTKEIANTTEIALIDKLNSTVKSSYQQRRS